MPPRLREADPRPALFSVVSLMFVLAPLLLVTTSPQKLTGLELGLLSQGGVPPLPPVGVIESLELAIQDQVFVIRLALRATDLTAGPGDVRLQEEVIPSAQNKLDRVGLQRRLRALKSLDPQRLRITLLPDEGVPVSVLVSTMDVVRADAQGPLFPEVVISSELEGL